MSDTPADEIRCCTPRWLPGRLLVPAAAVAVKVHPVNAPLATPAASVVGLPEPLQIAAITSKYWGPRPRTLAVQFLDNPTNECKTKILSHMNAWGKTICIRFRRTDAQGQVRIARAPGGYWSYVGTDILLVPPDRPTMNLEAFTAKVADSEYCRVVRHEAGHTLGFPHEHMRAEVVARIDVPRAVEYFGAACGWDAATVFAQVLTPIEEKSLMGTPADKDSIMCYQLPGAIMVDGTPVPGGLDIDAFDYAFAGRIYPKPSVAAGPPLAFDAADLPALAIPADFGAMSWDPSEDVHLGSIRDKA